MTGEQVGDVLVGEVGPVTVSGINVTTRWATVRNLTVDDILNLPG